MPRKNATLTYFVKQWKLRNQPWPSTAVEGRVPFDGLAHAGDGAHDERVEAAPDVAFPARHGRDVGLHGGVAVGLRDLGVAACEEGRLPAVWAGSFSDFAFFEGFDLPDLLRATAWRTSALKADSSTSSPSWMSIARRTFPSRLELKRRAGSFRDAPLAKVSFTTLLIGFARADDAVVRPDRGAGLGWFDPLPLLDDVRVCFLDELAHSAEGFPAPVPEFGDSFRDELRCRLALARARLFHVLILEALAGVACRRRQKKYESPQSTPVPAAQPHASGPSPTERWAMSAEPRVMAKPA